MSRSSSRSRPERPLADGELETLLGFLDYQRSIIEWKTQGLSAEGLRASVGASSITLGGLLKHLAFVEDFWFSRRLHGNAPAFSWVTTRWNTDSKRSWTPDPDDTWEELHDQWQEAVSRSRVMVQQAVAEGGLDGPARQAASNGTSPSLRWILLHMIEEYARHNGHADLIRESVDGLTGD